MPCKDILNGKPRRTRNVELLRRHSARDDLDYRLVLRYAEKPMRLSVNVGRDAPVEYAVCDAEVVERVAEVHHEYASVHIAVVAFPRPTDGGQVRRHDDQLVGVRAESARSSLRGEEPVPERRVVYDVNARVLAVAGARRGERERDGFLHCLPGDRPREVADDVARGREGRERRVLGREEVLAPHVRLGRRGDVTVRREERIEARHGVGTVPVQLAVGPADADRVAHLRVGEGRIASIGDFFQNASRTT